MNICSRFDCSRKFIPRKGSTGKFCSRRCSVIVNNCKYPKRGKRNRTSEICIVCFCKLKGAQDKFCSHICFGKSRADNVIKRWLSGESSGSDSSGVLSGSVRDYLIRKAKGVCTRCNWGEKNPFLGRVILTIDHIDGNWMNNSPENLQVLCFNCHSLTENFGSMNKNCPKKRPRTERIYKYS